MTYNVFGGTLNLAQQQTQTYLLTYLNSNTQDLTSFSALTLLVGSFKP